MKSILLKVIIILLHYRHSIAYINVTLTAERFLLTLHQLILKLVLIHYSSFFIVPFSVRVAGTAALD